MSCEWSAQDMHLVGIDCSRASSAHWERIYLQRCAECDRFFQEILHRADRAMWGKESFKDRVRAYNPP